MIPFWDGLKDQAWEVFQDPTNFGKDFEGISSFKSKRNNFIRTRVGDDLFSSTPRESGNNAMDPRHSNKRNRSRYAVYASRYAYFFSRSFFIRKAFETLNAETKPEHAGFRKACDTMFEVFRHQWDIPQESLVEYAYTDDTFMELDITRVGHFFAWIGVLRKTEDDSIMLTRVLRKVDWHAKGRTDNVVPITYPPLPPDSNLDSRTITARQLSGTSLRRMSSGIRTLIAESTGPVAHDPFHINRVISLQLCPVCAEPQLQPGDVVCLQCALMSRSYSKCPVCNIVREYNMVRDFFEDDMDIEEQPCVSCSLTMLEKMKRTISEDDKKMPGSPESSNILSSAMIPDNECPICLEVRDDVRPIEHWEAPAGDISEHKMCSNCLRNLPNNECPFCKEIISKDKFVDFIREFVVMCTSTAGTDSNVCLIYLLV